MSDSSASPRPRAVIAAAAILILVFLAFLAPLLVAGLRLGQSSVLASAGSTLMASPTLLANAVLLLVVCPFSARLMLGRSRSGHRLALALSGYMLCQAGNLLLAPYTWVKYSPLGGFLFWSGLVFFVVFGFLFYLLLRPEVFAYLRPQT